MAREREYSILNRRVSRRNLIRGAAAVGGTAAAGLLVRHEIDNLLNGVETDTGVFFPLYENHSDGIEDSHIPDDLDVFFREASNRPEDITLNRVRYSDRIDEKRLSKLAAQQTEIMFGDIDLNPVYESLGIILPTVELGVGINVYSGLERKAQKVRGTTRRRLLKGAARASLLWSATSVLRIPILLTNKHDDMNIRRIGARMVTPHAHLHPENYVLTLRSALWANKMLAVADEFKERTGRKAKIGFNCGSGHGNVEDFLELGSGFTRKIILSHPDFSLNDLVDLNGGVSAFASARLFKLPVDLNSENGSLEFGAKLEEAQERFVVDSELQRELKDKGL